MPGSAPLLLSCFLAGAALGQEPAQLVTQLHDARLRIAALDRQRAEPYQGSPADYQRDIKAFRDAYLAATRDHGLMSSAKRPVLAAKWLKMAADGGSASATVRVKAIVVWPPRRGNEEGPASRRGEAPDHCPTPRAATSLLLLRQAAQ